MMRAVLVALLVAAALPRPVLAAETSSSADPGIDLMELLEISAERLKKRFIIDPRVQGHALLVNMDPQRLSYADLQSILSVHGIVATEEANGTVRIVPDANARQLPMPLLKEEGGAPNQQMVTKVLDVGPLKATELVPLLRPLLPQYAHLVGHAGTNTLVVVARAENVKMIEEILQELRERPVPSN